MQRLGLNRGTVSLVVYLFYLGVLTLAPFDFSITAVTGRCWIPKGAVISDVGQNILGFVPLGVLLHFCMKPGARNMGRKWAWATGIAATVSLLIETAQLFLPTRDSSPVDVMSNTLGGGLGFWMAHRLEHRPWIVRLNPHRRTLTLISLAFYIAGLITLFLWAAPPQTLNGWDPSYPLLIGNETTLDRPWLGKIYFLALYPRALTAEEIKAQFQAGAHFKHDIHPKDAPIAEYAFQELGGTRIHDHSPVGVPLDLEITGPQEIMWIPEGGLELTRPTLVRSTKAAEKISQRFIVTNAFSVATWFEPKDNLQSGPARIVSLSQSLLVRNFYLGQEKSEVYFRVRNRVAGPSGTWVHLRTKGLGLRRQAIHLVAIYDRGTEQLYANGLLVEHTEMGGGLALIARELKINPTSRWQSALLLLLLLGPLSSSCVCSSRDGSQPST
jgi:glycopeptide antibiotics resistance protein